MLDVQGLESSVYRKSRQSFPRRIVELRAGDRTSYVRGPTPPIAAASSSSTLEGTFQTRTASVLTNSVV